MTRRSIRRARSGGVCALLLAVGVSGFSSDVIASTGDEESPTTENSSSVPGAPTDTQIETLPVYTDLAADGANASPPADSVSIAFVSGGIQDPFFSAMECGARQAADDYNVDLLWQGTQDTSTPAVLQVLDAVMVNEPDGLMFEPFDSQGLVAPTQEIIDGGTPVIIVDGSLAEPIGIQNPHTDSLAAGREAGEALGRAISPGGMIGVLSDSPDNAVQAARAQGFVDGLAATNPTAEILPIAYVAQDTAQAAQTVTSWMTANPDLKGIWATNGPLGAGAASAVKAAQNADILVYSYDTEPNQISALRAGDMDALIGQSPATDGYYSVKLLAQVLRGEVDPATLPYEVYAPFKLITSDNVDDPSSVPYIYGDSC